MEGADGMKFRLYDPALKKGSWVKANERDPSLDALVKQYNAADGETLVVEYQGRTLNLVPRTAKVVSSGSAAQPMAPQVPVGVNVPPSVTQAVVVNPTPADEAKRLQSVADEVARRRALREQAAQQMNQPVQPAVPQPQPPAPMPQPANAQQRPQRR